MKDNKQILGLQAVRGLAALCIVLYHYTSRYNDIEYVTKHGFWPFELSYGSFAVSLFFMISGYLTSMAVARREDPITFIKKRINRLYPTFWTALIVTYLVTTLFDMGSVSLIALVANISMVPMLLGVEPVDGVYWSQQYELLFYLFILFLLRYNSNWRLVRWGVIFLSLISCITYFVQFEIPMLLAKLLRVLFFTEYSSTFVMGLVVGLYDNKMMDKKMCFSTIIISLLSLYLWHGLLLSLSSAVFLICIVYVVHVPKSVANRDNFITRPLAFIASISYPLYLIHQKIGYIIISEIIDITGYDKEVIIIIPTLISCLIAYLLHKFVECNHMFRIFK